MARVSATCQNLFVLQPPGRLSQIRDLTPEASNVELRLTKAACFEQQRHWYQNDRNILLSAAVKRSNLSDRVTGQLSRKKKKLDVGPR